ncbi:hypothetical protein NL676_018780 [Syzygium grande]|nr:hypothetical protein NL676_018780 [Syzygium grande]
MREYLWFACGVTVSAILFTALLFKEFLKRSAGHLATKAGAREDAAVHNGTAAGRPAPDIDTAPVKRTATSSSGYDYEALRYKKHGSSESTEWVVLERQLSPKSSTINSHPISRIAVSSPTFEKLRSFTVLSGYRVSSSLMF